MTGYAVLVIAFVTLALYIAGEFEDIDWRG